MQEPNEVGKFVTDGQMVYPYNAYLDEMVKSGKLQYCERPAPIDATTKVAPKPQRLPSPIMMPPEERLALAAKWGMTLNELTNMSPQEYAAELAKREPKEVPETDGFPAA
jgi:hypothetical protein